MDIDRIVKVNNFDKFDKTRADEKYGIPFMKQTNVVPTKLIDFTHRKKDVKAGIHFFLDDYQIEAVWNSPDKYIKEFAEREAVLSPNFSVFTDMPFAMQIWNVYRSAFIGQYFSDFGINVIPTACWGDTNTFDFAFEGLPEHSTIAVSTLGCKKDKSAKRIFQQGFEELLKRKEPSQILLYGGKADFDFYGLKIVEFPHEMAERFSKLKKGV